MRHATLVHGRCSTSSSAPPPRSKRTPAAAECFGRLGAEVGYLAEREAMDLERDLGLAMRAIVGLLPRPLAF
jgi:hypothetical protein